MSEAKPSFWKRTRYALESATVRFFAFLVPLLPRFFILWLARLLGRLAFWFDKRGRTTALENIRVAFGDTLDTSAQKRIAVKSFQNFARTMLDLFWFTRLNRKNYTKYIEINFPPELEEKAREKGAIWVTPHYGNFEGTLSMGFRDFPFMIVMEAQKNPALTKVFIERRSISGHQIILQEGAVIRLLKHLKKGGHAAFLTDLTIPPGKASTAIECFGLYTCVTAVHALLAQRTDLPVIPCYFEPLKNGNYTLHLFDTLEIAEDATVQEIAQQCWDIFEPHIRKKPEFWLWMYKHWRYLPPGEEAGENYPKYANRKKGFDKMVNALKEPQN